MEVVAIDIELIVVDEEDVVIVEEVNMVVVEFLDMADMAVVDMGVEVVDIIVVGMELEIVEDKDGEVYFHKEIPSRSVDKVDFVLIVEAMPGMELEHSMYSKEHYNKEFYFA